jgi:hypothetical protein
MQKRILSAVLLATCALHGLIGCKGKGGSSSGQSTPRDAAYKLATSMLEFDKGGFMECLTGSQQELRAAEGFMDYLCAAKEFKDAVVEAYGRRGWQVFEAEGGAKLTGTVSDNRDKLDDVQWKVSGETAEGQMPGQAQIVHLTRKEGRWYVHARDIITGGADNLEEFASRWSRMAALLRAKKGRIGQPGVTAEALDKELGAEMMAILLGAGAGRP